MSVLRPVPGPLPHEPLSHRVEYFWCVQHDGVPRARHQLEVGLGQRALHLALLHQADQAALQVSDWLMHLLCCKDVYLQFFVCYFI